MTKQTKVKKENADLGIMPCQCNSIQVVPISLNLIPPNNLKDRKTDGGENLIKYITL